MLYKKLGATGIKVSEICLGTMQFGWTADEPLSHDILTRAYHSGVTFFDTADVYSRWVEGNPGGVAETIIGNWIKKHKIPREQIILATKVRGRMGDGSNDEGLSRAHILHAIDVSLRRLQTDYIDLYQTHWYDAETPIEETLSVLNDLVHQGKVRYVGCSNYPAWRLTEAILFSRMNNWVRYETLQPNYSLVKREEFEGDLAEVCTKYNLGVIPYSPLGAGFLTGKYRRDSEPASVRINRARSYYSDKNWDLLDKLETIGHEKGGKSISQIALAWLLNNPIITSPIIGPRTMEQLEDNLGAVGISLSEHEYNSLTETKGNKTVS